MLPMTLRLPLLKTAVPVGGNTIATYWITDRIVYAMDVQRGLDILEFTGSL